MTQLVLSLKIGDDSDGVVVDGPARFRIMAYSGHGRVRVAIEAPTTTDVIRDKAIHKQPRNKTER